MTRALHLVATAAGATLYAFALLASIVVIVACVPFIRAGAKKEAPNA